MSPPEAFRAADGLPPADPRETRIARAVAVVASVWFALAASWELFGPLLAGHYASSASVGIVADNMLRWKIPGPVWEYVTSRPRPSAYYCHHPWGIFWTTAGLMKLLGRHDFVCRLPAVLLSAATPPLLYLVGRSIWRPAAGAAAAAAFVVLPITLAFANFNALEVPVIAWSLVALWGLVRLGQTWRRRWLVVSTAGALLAMNADWPAFVLVGELLAFGLVRGMLLGPGVFGRVDARRFGQWWAIWASALALTLLGYLVVFQKSGALGDLLASYGLRSAGSDAPLSKVLSSRRYWLELSFSPVAIALGKLAAVVCVLRLVVLRREHELLPLAVLGMATFQYVVFKQGADVHVFWPHYFGAYFALGMGALVATLASALALVPRWARAAGPSALGVALLPLAVTLRDGLPALRYARDTGGRFNEKGLLIHSDGAKTAFLAWMGERTPKDAIVELHEGMKATWSQAWALGGRVIRANRPAPTQSDPAARGPWLADSRFLLDETQAAVAAGLHVVAVGPFWAVSADEPNAPIDAFSFVEREPTALEWYFVSGTEPVRSIAPDPFLTWQLRAHFGQPATAPTEPPRTLEQRSIAHNVALATGDLATADALYASIAAELSPTSARFDDGSEIVGAQFRDGARPLLSIVVRAGGPTAADVQLGVRSKVVAPAPLSTTMADPLEREVGLPLPIAPKRWKRGHLYVDAVAIRKRPGTEVFRAYFWVRGKGAPPRRDGGGPEQVEVLTLD